MQPTRRRMLSACHAIAASGNGASGGWASARAHLGAGSARWQTQPSSRTNERSTALSAALCLSLPLSAPMKSGKGCPYMKHIGKRLSLRVSLMMSLRLSLYTSGTHLSATTTGYAPNDPLHCTLSYRYPWLQFIVDGGAPQHPHVHCRWRHDARASDARARVAASAQTAVPPTAVRQ